jgi:quinol monooxygenase YgiN
MIFATAELRLKPGMADKAAAAARTMVAETVKEDGCLFYDFNLSVTDPTRLIAVERWTSRETLARHMQTAHFKAWIEAGKEFVASRSIHVVTAAHVETW